VYLINRQPVSTHRLLLKSSGFDCLHVAADETPSAIGRHQLSRTFASNTDEDLQTSSAFMVSRRAASCSSSLQPLDDVDGAAVTHRRITYEPAMAAETPESLATME
jgi:hypothetical protein